MLCSVRGRQLRTERYITADAASTSNDEEGEREDTAEGAGDGVPTTPASPRRISSGLSAALELAKQLDRLRPEWERWQAWLQSRCGGGIDPL